jgi:hypothetical protein
MAAIPTDQEALWNELKPLAESGDSAALVARIGAMQDDGERISAYRLAFGKWRFLNGRTRTSMS